MRFEGIVLLAAAAGVTAQSVVGKAYGFAKGVTGGGSAKAVTPTTNEELAKYLADSEPRVILLTKTFDFTGTSAVGAGCDRQSCSAASGKGQWYLGDLSCGGDDRVPTNNIKYDAAGPKALPVQSNKSIIGVGGKGVLKGKGLSVQKNAKNVIIQGITFTTINPSVVWGGDALDFQGGNDGVWVDHNKFELTGRMFLVSHYAASRLTVSNNEFNGKTSWSASCNGNHYWTMMFYGDGDKVTLDRNYFHDVSGRAPKLGQDGTKGLFHATNNLFSNMKGHAFDVYQGANALVEGNVFESVSQPATDKAASISTFITNAGSACSSSLGRACQSNSVDSKSGKLGSGTSNGFISQIKANDVSILATNKVAAHVRANAGPAKLGSAGVAETEAPEPTPEEDALSAAPIAPTTPAAAPPTSELVATTPGSAAGSTPGSAAAASLYAQCGGQGWNGPTTCAQGICVKANEWYSQCLTSSKFRL